MKVDMNIILNASADQIWETVGDFNGLPKFVPAAKESSTEGEGKGALRTIVLPDGSKLVERLESYDDQNKTYSYTIVSGPLPVEKYFSTVRVNPIDRDKAEVVWTGTFEPAGDPEEAKRAIQKVYASGLDGLARIFGKS